MVSVQSSRVRDDTGAVIAALITRQQSSPLPRRYRPLIGMLATSTSGGARGQVMGTDAACIEAVLSLGAEVRLIPVHRPHPPQADAFEMVLDTVLAFDGLLFSGGSDNSAARVDVLDQHSDGAESISLVDWWVMLMTLMARQTLTPLLAIGPDAASVNLALGGTLRRDVIGQRDASASATLHHEQTLALDLDPVTLAQCARGSQLSSAGEEDHRERPVPRNEADEVCCGPHHAHAVATLAPGWQAWGWHKGRIEGFGYPGPSPWCALATQFHPEWWRQDALSRSLLSRYLRACRDYANSLRDVLKSTRMRDKLLRALYLDPLAQPLLSHPFLSETDVR